MKKRSSKLGHLGEQFFALMQMKHQEQVRLGELQQALNITPKQEKELLSRLARAGYILRLLRGVYLVPAKLPPGGRWMPDEYTIVFELMKLLGARYQISGPLAFQRYGLSEQIPNVITIYNDKKSGLQKIGSLTIQLVKVSPERVGGTETIALSDGKQVYIANLARTLVDAVYDWSRFNTLPKAYDWIAQYQQNPELIKALITITIQYSNVSTMRRIGYVLEILGISPRKTQRLFSQLKPTQSWIPLNPSKPAKGITNKKWGIIDNG